MDHITEDETRENKAPVITGARGVQQAEEPREVPGGSLDACGDDSQAHGVDMRCSGVMMEMLELSALAL